MKMIFSILKNEKGTSGVGVILACFVIGLVMVMTLEIFRYYTIKDSMDKELSRAVNIAIDMSMDDEKRKLHISSIDIDKAIQSFYSYLRDELKLDDELKYDDNKLKYQLHLSNINVESDPEPKFEVDGVVILKVGALSGIIPYDIEIPVKAKARNQRMDEE